MLFSWVIGTQFGCVCPGVFGLACGEEASGLCNHAPERLALDATPETRDPKVGGFV